MNSVEFQPTRAAEMDESEIFKKMFQENCRLETFGKWPLNKNFPCNPKNLAKAGFYKVYPDGTDDAVRCFACCKELDNWEATDDPMEEHRGHSKKCPYLLILDKKPFEDITFKEFIDFQAECLICNVTKHHMGKIEEFMNHAKETEKKFK